VTRYTVKGRTAVDLLNKLLVNMMFLCTYRVAQNTVSHYTQCKLLTTNSFYKNFRIYSRKIFQLRKFFDIKYSMSF